MPQSLLEAAAKLDPPEIWQLFAALTKIPRPSGHEQAVGDYIVTLAREHGLEADKDEVGNVLIKAPATPGHERVPAIILQGHLDMVPAAGPGVEHDFVTQPIEAMVEDGFVRARGTSLGADDGLGVAVALALLCDRSLPHGPLRAVFTVEEETTMRGARGLNPQVLDAPYLINLDGEEDGQVYISCAGSWDWTLSVTAPLCPPPAQGVALNLELIGALGGHSGADIALQHLNPLKTLGEILAELSCDEMLWLSDCSGGTVRNSIPREARAVLVVNRGRESAAAKRLQQSFERFLQRHRSAESALKLNISVQTQLPEQVIGCKDSQNMCNLLATLPHGVERWEERAGVPETSCNVGIASLSKEADGGTLELIVMVRSLSEAGLDILGNRLKAAAALVGGCTAVPSNRHPCWLPVYDNILLEALRRNYREVSGRELAVTAMHAGLECSAFARSNPKLQMVSTGSCVLNPHTPQERAGIAGVRVLYDTLRQTLSAFGV